MMKTRRDTTWYPWTCWGIAASTYLFAYCLIALPSALSQEIQNKLSIDNTGIGILSSAFLYTYVLMQIPAGLLFDRYNARNLLFCSTCIMALGCILMAFSNHLTSTTLSRMLMGLGGSLSFVGTVYLARMWFTPKIFPFIVGLTEIMSGIGVIIANTVFTVLSSTQHWHTIVLEFSIILTIIAILILIFIREREEKRQTIKTKEHLKKNIKLVFESPIVWLTALYTGFGFTHYLTLTNLWTPRFLEMRYHIPKLFTGIENSIVVFGFMIGSPLCGYIARYYGDLNVMLVGAILQLGLLTLSNYLQLPLWLLSQCLLFLGISTGSIMIGFDIIRKSVPEQAHGLGFGFNNMFFGGISILISPLVGYLYQTYSKNFEIAVLPVIFCSATSVLFCIALMMKTRKLKIN